MSSEKPKKIVIFGSGVASLAAAVELTSVPDWQSKYDITIYQPGWRSGGKTTTGRGKYDRIEEVGIHIFQGWYDNAFNVVKQLYEEIEEKKLHPASPFRTWTDAFAWENSTLLTEYYNNQWHNWTMVFPNNSQLPGGNDKNSFPMILKKLSIIILETLVGAPYGKKGMFASWFSGLFEGAEGPKSNIPNDLRFKPSPTKPEWWCELMEDVKNNTQPGEKNAEYGQKCLHKLINLPDNEQGFEQKAALLEEFMVWADRFLAKKILTIPAMRRMKIMLEFFVVTTIGAIRDVADRKKGYLDFDRINHLDFREWLAKHGASQMLLESAPVRFLYTGTFANTENKIEAGTALHFLALSVGYKGAFVWKFKAGTGDTLIMPFYLVLKNRGVKFKYFHKIKKIYHSNSGKIEKIDIAEQVKLRDGITEYDPRTTLRGVYVWPAQPNYDQIDPAQAAALQAQQIDLESAWAKWDDYRQMSLTLGTDFDEAILGVPIEVLRGQQGVCTELIDNQPKWKQMADAIVTTATQAVQTWIYPTIEQMGMHLPSWGLDPAKGTLPNLVAYANPMYSWIDVSAIIDQENWPSTNAPKSLFYICGSLPQPRRVPLEIPDYPQQQMLVVQQNSKMWLQSQTAWFFPLVANPPEFPAGIKLEVLWSEMPDATDDERLAQQYYRANVEPSDRWTLSLPNTSRTRLEVDGSGYENLYLAGDWVKMEINVGYTDGAMTSGLRAAQALMRKLGITPIHTYSDSKIYI